MKKAQVLSAIALAFALGVVAPVASANAICPITIEVRETAEATEQEGENAVAYVNRNATYKKVAAVAAAIAKYWGTNGTDSSNGINPTLTATVANIKAHMDALNGQSVDGNGGDAKIASTYNSGTTNLGTLASDAHNTTTNYDLYANFIAEMAKTTDFKVSAVAGIVAQMRTAGIVASNFDLSTWGDTAATGITVTTKTAVETALGGAGTFTRIANYSAYKDLVDDVENITNYSNAYDAIAPKIAAAVDTTAGQTASDANEKYTTTIAALAGEAVDANIADYTVWETVYKDVLDVEKDQAKAARYTAIVKLAHDWKIALPETDCLETVIAEEMMAYNAPSTPNNPDEGGNEGDGDGETDPSAPGTGLVSAAEGNAATTVSIVAGLATALTALGAGVVAYRSARRSNK